MNQYFNKLLAPTCTCGIQNKIIYYPVFGLFEMHLRTSPLKIRRRRRKRKIKNQLRVSCVHSLTVENKAHWLDFHMIERECIACVNRRTRKGEKKTNRIEFFLDAWSIVYCCALDTYKYTYEFVLKNVYPLFYFIFLFREKKISSRFSMCGNFTRNSYSYTISSIFNFSS